MKLLILLGPFVIVWLTGQEFHEADRELREAIAELDKVDPGWRLNEIEASRRKILEEQDSVPIIISAHEALPKNSEKITRGLEAVHKIPPPVLLEPVLEKELFSKTKLLEPAMQKARRLTDFPYGRYKITYGPTFNYGPASIGTPQEEQWKAQRLADLLSLDVRKHIQKGDLNGALQSTKAILSAGRSLGDEPLYLSLIHRTMITHSFIRSLERTLAQGDVKEAALGLTQDLLDKEAKEKLHLVAMRGERAGLHHLFSNIEKGDVFFSQFAHGMKKPVSLREKIETALLQPRIRRNHAWLLHSSIVAMKVAQIASSKSSQQARDLFSSWDRSFYKDKDKTMALLLYPPMKAIMETEQRRVSHLNCALSAVAAERYRLKHKRWPDSLEQLVNSGFLNEVPLDLFSDQALRHRVTKDAVVIYSVGPKGNSRGDSLDDLQNYDENAVRLEFRLWNPDRRRQKPA